MKKFSFPAFILLAIVLGSFCLPGSPIAVKQHTFFTDTLQTPLVLYGSYIYQRENCSRCHILEDDSTNKRMISLDGVGKKYPASWHYRHIKEPTTMVAFTSMPAFPHLFTQQINQAKLLELYLRQSPQHHSSDSNWLREKQQQEAAVIDSQLAKWGISNAYQQQKEIVALIAYLQQIPPGAAHLYKDSLWFAGAAARNMEWNNNVEDSNSTLMRYANSTNKDIIAKGKSLFGLRCYMCHGKEGQGGVGPNLTDAYWLNGSKGKQIVQAIAYGAPDKGMMSFKSVYDPEEIGMLTAYIRSLKGTHPKNAKAPQGIKE